MSSHPLLGFAFFTDRIGATGQGKYKDYSLHLGVQIASQWFSSGYWSGTTGAGGPSYAWGVNFNFGQEDWYHKTSGYYVRCVCGTPLPPGSYVDNHDGTVADTRTGLMWQQGDSQNDQGGRNWRNALAYCEDLSLAGHDDWRLPNIREFLSLVDDTRTNPAIDPLFQCPSTAIIIFWSSSTYGYSAFRKVLLKRVKPVMGRS
jgi:hypothetical protein